MTDQTFGMIIVPAGMRYPMNSSSSVRDWGRAGELRSIEFTHKAREVINAQN